MDAIHTHAILLLAAGAATRMGEAKQLLPINGKSLLRTTAEEAMRADLGPLTVVLGAFAEQTQKELQGLSLSTVMNPDWQEGMGTSIRCGMRKILQEQESLQGVIIMLADQPYADAQLLSQLVQAHQETKKPIIASAYQETLGVPAYFHHSFFPKLSQLSGAVGARKLIKQEGQQVASIDFPRGNMDIDTPEDYRKIKEEIERNS